MHPKSNCAQKQARPKVCVRKCKLSLKSLVASVIVFKPAVCSDIFFFFFLLDVFIYLFILTRAIDGIFQRGPEGSRQCKDTGVAATKGREQEADAGT